MYKWGHTFLELNREMLETYAGAKDSTEVVEIQKQFITNMEIE
jgi:pre-rRNA-processing protein TSR3